MPPAERPRRGFRRVRPNDEDNMALGRSRGTDAGSPTGPTSGRESGQALLELALVVPILVLLILAIFQFAYVLETQIGLTNAVREAARRVVTSPGATVSWTEDQLLGSGGVPGLLAENISGYSATRLVPDAGGDDVDVSFCSFLIGTETNYRVDIRVEYNHPVFFGLLVYATDATDANPGDGEWTLAAATQMRLEHVGTFDATGVPACP
jgi:hypothetical protein